MIFTDKNFIQFCIKLIVIFLILYYGLLFITGVAAEGGLHSTFIEKYFNVSSWIRESLIHASQYLLSFFNINTIRTSEYIFKIEEGVRGVSIIYGCLGFGIMSFWTAYVIAVNAKILNKLQWLLGGLFFLWALNVVRISLVLVSANKGWYFPFKWDHHTWFNIIAYCAIFTMIYFFEKNIKNNASNKS
jgi:exosortase/archaeosortase family protein